MRHVLLYGQFHGNFGVDFTAVLLCRRYPKVTFHLLAEKESQTAFSALPNVVIHTPEDPLVQQKNQWMEKYRRTSNGFLLWMASQCYATIQIGAAVFVQRQQDFSQDYQLDADLCRHSKRLYVIGAHFGPYSQGDYYRRYHALFARYRGICFRDSSSFDKFQDLPRVRWAPDPAFTYSPVQTLTPAQKQIIVSVCGKEHLGETFITRQDQEDFEANLIQVCSRLMEEGYRIVLLSLSPKEGDEAMAERICAAIRPEYASQVERLSYQGSLEPILDVFAKAERVIAAQFHSAVLGWLFGKPVLPIVRDLKCAQLFQDDQPEFCTLEEWCGADPQELCQKLQKQPPLDCRELQQKAEAQFYFTDRALNSRLGLFG